MMPRPKKPGAPEPKRRSRNGCCCQRTGETCDYSIRLNWDGRRGKRAEAGSSDLSQEPPSAPAKGFKLVHQYPLLDAPGGRRLEPLTQGSDNQPKYEQQKVLPPATVTFVDAAPAAVVGPEISQRPNKRAKLKSEIRSAEPSENRPYSSHSSTVDSTSAYSDDDQRQSSRSDAQSISSPDLRRLSVNSLLAGPPSLRGLPDENGGHLKSMLPPLDTRPRSATEATYYGVDRGFPDLDLGKNDDMNAITGSSPMLQREFLDSPFGESSEDAIWNEFGFGVETNDANNEEGYYSKPVPIYIPRSLQPLPPKLRDNPMNLLYFHHYLNHTARVLVPYDDPHANPFRNILPLMAIKNDNLLALLLAYSASHRARVLNHPEPTLRIAFWVDDVFPALRQALDDPDRNFSDANLATAIMLTSLEIISPQVFGYDIPWQKHLSLARELITARPGGLHGMQANFRQDRICSFLWSWAAYLDVIGSLSGGPKGSSSAWIFDYEVDDIVDGYDEIDCIMGFTTRCVYLLAKIADLARRCDAERIGEDLNVREDWVPSDEVVDQAQKLGQALRGSMEQAPEPCKHIHKEGDIAKWNRTELEATNKAFHWAGLVHLYRRILNKPSADALVQDAVQKIIGRIRLVRPGGSGESCLLFPMFTAGCDARGAEQREYLLQRFLTAENHGMTQVHNARRLMEKVWQTGKPWESLVSTEFIG
ncbi:hypothetical protein F4780DRAFT_336287 [Xylariomycetidae sp. FL0641]|nr:hypothetical protein F4780DRAFT_336287 [Xylariomycetidae sp. FL0641]